MASLRPTHPKGRKVSPHKPGSRPYNRPTHPIIARPTHKSMSSTKSMSSIEFPFTERTMDAPPASITPPSTLLAPEGPWTVATGEAQRNPWKVVLSLVAPVGAQESSRQTRANCPRHTGVCAPLWPVSDRAIPRTKGLPPAPLCPVSNQAIPQRKRSPSAAAEPNPNQTQTHGAHHRVQRPVHYM